jgi:hypothetical protein
MRVDTRDGGTCHKLRIRGRKNVRAAGRDAHMLPLSFKEALKTT